MALSFLLKGALIGFSIAVPVGPIGVLCIRRTLAFGRLSGFFSGLGAAVADALYGLILVSGLTLVSDFLINHQSWFRLVGGAFLFYLGYKTFKAPHLDSTKKITHKTLLSDFVSTFFLTIANPLTIISYLAVFASLGVSDLQGNWLHAALIVIGIFLGAAFWWLILSEGLTLFRKKVTAATMPWINRIAGILIASFGLLAWISLRF